VPKAATGRPARYCSAACRQAAHRERVGRAAAEARRAAELAAVRATVDNVRAAAAGTLRQALSGSRDALILQLAELRAQADELRRQAISFGQPPRPGPGPTNLERWLLAALDENGVAYRRFARVGRYEADAMLPEHMVIIEVDGVRWHRKREAYDRQRDADLMAAGYTVVHFTDLEMNSQAKARGLVAELITSIRAGQQRYRPPLLWD
jgi:very-short-patch-repair endonuclease